MDLKQLKYFLNVAQLGSYTRAADLLGVAQPVLSRQIRLLETELRHNLFTRHGRGVTLTEPGRILLEHSRIILHQVDCISDDLHALNGKLGGHIVLGLPPTMAKLLSVPLIRAFRERLPDAKLRIAEGLSIRLQERLLQGNIDIALLNNPAYSPDIDTQLLYEEQLCLMVPQNSSFLPDNEPVGAAQLAVLPLIAPSAPNTFRLLIEQQMARHNLMPNVVLEIDSVETMLQLVAEGMGCAILSAAAIELARYQDRIRIMPIAAPQFISRLFLATANKTAPTRTQREIMKLLAEMCAGLAQQHPNCIVPHSA